MPGALRASEGLSAGRKKAAPKSRLQVARMLLGLLGGLGRLAVADFARCRVVDLADVVGLDRKSLVLHAGSRVRLWLDLAFNDGLAHCPGSGKSNSNARGSSPHLVRS